MFKDQIGCKVEVYIDDLLVKSKEPKGHLDDLQEAFAVLKKYRMELNPTKYTFGVESGKFLRFKKGGAGVHMIPDEGCETYYLIMLEFKTTNNEAEYEALLVGLAILRTLGVTNVKVMADSKVVVNQVKGKYVAKIERLHLYLQQVWKECDHLRLCHRVNPLKGHALTICDHD
ncbi:uncharacterized protein LOC121244235 [Juglans microcarpa x Juglans regia]|uniref:uncharacterized protein LOC121244235 n=1 Tax=Juglans microcarpa x Juglans regia TaxID=2249226 RepID=UPI001B7F0E3F|nr:uncharacterized protein LOC121244235 [Juglans microcarpa x Juglans regia]